MSCSKENAWEPKTEQEKNIKLINCNFWSKIPYNLNAKAFIEEDSEGYINKFYTVFKSKDEKDFEENFRFFYKAIFNARKNDSINLSGSHMYYFANENNVVENITNKKCIDIKSNCVIVAAFERTGGPEFLKVDGSNSMIESSVTFKNSKNSDKLQCLKWNYNEINNIWESKMIDCGIGINKETGKPVVVDVFTNSATSNKIMLDKLCKNYENLNDVIIENGEEIPCGLFTDSENGEVFAYQVIDKLKAKEGFIKELYATNIFAEEINADFIKVKKDLSVMGNTDINGNLSVNDTATFNNNIQLNKIEVAGNNCAKNGTIARDFKGAILACESGFWRKSNKERQDAEIYKLDPELWPNSIGCYTSNNVAVTGNFYAYKDSNVTYLVGASHQIYFNSNGVIYSGGYGSCSIGTKMIDLIKDGLTTN